jgi:DNA-binding protein HU-beta
MSNNQRMTKAEFVDLLARDQRLGSRRRAATALDAVLEGISSVLGDGQQVNLTGFGKFWVAERVSRRGVNPRTGESITIPARRSARFTAGAALKSRVRS